MTTAHPPCICGHDGKLTSVDCPRHGAHDALVAALERSLNWLASYPGEGAMSAYEQARAALAAAKGDA